MNPTQRFTNRVAYYHASRPRYPVALLECLQREIGFTPQHVIADIGSGTGISAELFLQNGNVVYAVEPNDAMRTEAETHYANYAGLHSVNGTAEVTTLPDASVDLVTAGQAFHWFNVPDARVEFRRILKPNGHVGLFWNSRQLDSTPFLAEYEAILNRYSTDYALVNHQSQTRKKTDSEDRDAIAQVFGASGYQLYTFPNQQVLDETGFIGRALSSSYVPLEGQPNHTEIMAALRALFATYQDNGHVTLEYVTELFLGAVD